MAVLRFSVCTIFLAITGFELATAGTGGECYVNSGYDYSPNANDLANRKPLDLAGCCSWCQRESDCKAFVWLAGSSDCYLKSGSGKAIPLANSFYGFPGPNPADKNFECSGGLSQQNYYPPRMGYLEAFDADKCCSYCQLIPRCTGYRWAPEEGGNCFLARSGTEESSNK